MSKAITSVENDPLLDLANIWVYEKTGQQLSDLQRLVLQTAWQPTKKTYQEIAEENNYSSNYLQYRVAPELWHLLSTAAGRKVTKSNCKAILSGLLNDYANAPILTTQQHQPSDPNKSHLKPNWLEIPDGAVALNSPFYVQRSPLENRCCQAISQPASLIRIKAPRQMGKTSLMNRILVYADGLGYKTISVNFQQADQTILSDLNRTLRWLCSTITQQFRLSPALDSFWDEDIGSKMSCTLYLEGYILAHLETPLVLALDEASEIFDYPEVSREFFGMLCTWHEYTKSDQVWQKLRLIIIQSTESYVPLNINQSPFNVGFEVTPKPFTAAQVCDLLGRYQLALEPERLQALMALTGGHPYLIRLACYHLATNTASFETLIAIAPTDEGIYSHHLHRLLWYLQQQSELGTAFKKVLDNDKPTDLSQVQRFKLQSLGLVTKTKNQVKVSCDLYQQYFQEQL